MITRYNTRYPDAFVFAHASFLKAPFRHPHPHLSSPAHLHMVKQSTASDQEPESSPRANASRHAAPDVDIRCGRWPSGACPGTPRSVVPSICRDGRRRMRPVPGGLR